LEDVLRLRIRRKLPVCKWTSRVLDKIGYCLV
jgi:hypothetical protein